MQMNFNIVAFTQDDIQLPDIPPEEKACKIVITDERGLSPILLTASDNLKILINLTKLINHVAKIVPVTDLHIHNAIDLSSVIEKKLKKFTNELTQKKILLHLLTEDEARPHFTKKTRSFITNKHIESTIDQKWGKLLDKHPFKLLSDDEKVAVKSIRKQHKVDISHKRARARHKEKLIEEKILHSEVADKNSRLRSEVSMLEDKISVLRQNVQSSQKVLKFMSFFKSAKTSCTALQTFDNEAVLNLPGAEFLDLGTFSQKDLEEISTWLDAQQP